MKDALLEHIVGLPLNHLGRPPDATVPCGSCKRCCQGNSIVMLMPDEGDVVETYEHEYVDLPGAGRGPIIKRYPNGDCVYLGENGCTIHDRAPVVCRVFDCRGAYLAFMQYPRQERKRMIRKGIADNAILDIGRTMLAAQEKVP